MAIKFLNDGDFPDNAKIRLGDANDLEIYHNGTNSKIESKTGNLNISATNTDGDIKFFADDGAGSTAQYIRIDGGAEQTLFFKNTEHQDNVQGTFGNAGDLTLYHDGTDSYIQNATGDLYVDGNGDDLFLRGADDVIIKSQGSENAIYCTGNAGVQIYHNNSEKLETKQDGIEVTGNIDILSNGEVELDGNGGVLLNTAPSGTEGNGIIIKLHSTATTAGNLYYKSNFAAAWSLADADSDGATRMLAVALGSNSGTGGMLLQGIFRKASHGFSAGAPLYVSTTAGAFTTTAPSGSGDYVRVVGYVIDSNTIYFSPGTAWVEVS